VHDEEVAVTSRDAHAKFLRLMKTLLPTPDSSIRERPDSIDSNILTPETPAELTAGVDFGMVMPLGIDPY
jgi:hypothetical protein